MSYRCLVFCLGLLSATFAHAQAGTTRPFRYDDNFKSLQIDDNTFEVAVHSPSGMSGTLSRSYFLCKSAELTLRNGGKYFVYLKDERGKDSRPNIRKISNISKAIHSNSLIIGLNPQELKVAELLPNDTRYTSIGVIRISPDVPTEGEYYDAELINRKMVPKIRKKVKREGNVSFFMRVYEVLRFANQMKR